MFQSFNFPLILDTTELTCLKGPLNGARFSPTLLTFYRVFQLTIPWELNFPRRKRGGQVFRSHLDCDLGVEVLILTPKETYNTCNFPGWVSRFPDPNLSMYS